MSDPLFVVLNQGDHPPVEWFRKYKANVARLRTCDQGRIAEVVKFLTDWDARTELSQGERRILNRAVQMLIDPDPTHGAESGATARLRDGERAFEISSYGTTDLVPQTRPNYSR